MLLTIGILSFGCGNFRLKTVNYHVVVGKNYLYRD